MLVATAQCAKPALLTKKVQLPSSCPDFDNFRQPMPNNVKILSVARVLSFVGTVEVAIQCQRMRANAAEIAAHLQRRVGFG